MKSAKPADAGLEPVTKIQMASPPSPKSRSVISAGSPIFKDVQVTLKARLGEATLSMEALMGLSAGSVVKLDTQMNELVDLHLNGSLVARGEIVAVDDNFGVRIVEIAELS